MKLTINRDSSTPLSRQIGDQIRDLIRSGQIRHQERLPSTRLLSKELGVNRVTVTQAYKDLIADGLASSGVGSGTYIIYEPTSKLDRSNLTPRFSDGIQSLIRSIGQGSIFDDIPKNTINFATLIPDEQTFPLKEFKECINQVMDEEGPRILQYAGSMGYAPLRGYLSQRLKKRGVDVSMDQILLVNGAQQGLDLVLRCFISPKDQVALGFPTYHNIFPITEQLRAGVVRVAMTDQGLDLTSLQAAVKDRSVRLIYTMPNFQNPTGVTMDTPHRQGVYQIAKQADLTVLEDDFEMELSLEDQTLPPIKALDQDGRVIYLGTFSKSLFPGLRIGWLVASKEVIRILCALKKATDLEGSALLQAAAYKFCTQGHYDTHLTKIRAMIRTRMKAALKALETHMPAGVSWKAPRGGYALWVNLPPGVSSERVFENGKKAGVLVSPGAIFSGQGPDPGGVRLSLSYTDSDQIQKGVALLAQAIQEETEKGNNFTPEAGQHL